MKNLAGWPSRKCGRNLWQPKIQNGRRRPVDHCVLNGLAYIAALHLGSGVIWGKEFICDVRFIVLQMIYL